MLGSPVCTGGHKQQCWFDCSVCALTLYIGVGQLFLSLTVDALSMQMVCSMAAHSVWQLAARAHAIKCWELGGWETTALLGGIVACRGCLHCLLPGS